MAAFIHGIILAVGLILPLGVQNLYVFQQGMLQKNFLRALPVVITAAVCDTVLIIAAVNGISLLLMRAAFLQLILIGGGAVFLIFMGWKTWHSSAQRQEENQRKVCSARQQVLSAAAVSLLNPYAILDIIGVIGTSSVHYQSSDKFLFMSACILVSWLWFGGLAIAGRSIGSKTGHTVIHRGINRFSALFMWGAAIYLVFPLVT